MIFHHFTMTGLAQPGAPTDEAARQAELAAANAGALARNSVEELCRGRLRLRA
jgi:hypothetical protein